MFDDNIYITGNNDIKNISWNSIAGFFTNYYAGNYHPLTMLSYAVDYQLFGYNAAGYHLVSVFLHLISVVFVFLIFKKLSDNFIIIIGVTAIFALHPVQVESVAWLAERKNLLYAVFYLTGIFMYLQYHETKKMKWLVMAFLLFVASCLSKALAVSFPLTMLILDYLKKQDFKSRHFRAKRIPFFVVSLFFGILAIMAQESMEYVSDSIGQLYSLGERSVLACFAFSRYLLHALIPVNLSAFYPYPHVPDSSVIVKYGYYLFVFLAYCGILVWSFRKKPVVFAALAFFLVQMLFVVQIFPYANILMADRYLYLALPGIAVLIVVFFARLAENTSRKAWPILILIAYITFLGISSFQNAKKWQDSMHIFNSILEKNPEAVSFLNLRGVVYKQKHEYKKALADFNKCLQIHPGYLDAYNNRGNVYLKLNNFRRAIRDFERYIESNPGNSLVYSNYGIAHARSGNIKEAINAFYKAIELNPQNYKALANLGKALAMTGDLNSGLLYLNRSVEQNPAFAEAYITRAMVFLNLDKKQNAYHDLLMAKKHGIPEADSLLMKYFGHPRMIDEP